MSGTLVGVVLITRHGDRTKYFQDPASYTSTGTEITSLGELESYQQGEYIRSRYFDGSSSNLISGISQTVVDVNQIDVETDAGGEGNVILLSAYALWQGVYPATSQANVTLANGTVVESPLGGLQYVPINTVETATSPILEPWTSCPAYTSYLSSFYKSSTYTAKTNASQTFLTAIATYVDGRSTTLQNMYNVYDYMNVGSIYNSTYAAILGNTTLAQTRDIANWLSNYVFSGPSLNSIGNIAGRALFSDIITSMNTIVSGSGVKFAHYAVGYQPFVSVFNMTGVSAQYSEVFGITDYASMAAFEIRKNSSGYYVNFVYKNGSSLSDSAKSYQIFNQDSVSTSTFISKLNSSAIYTTLDWCNACNQTGSTRSCDTLIAASKYSALLASTSASATTSSKNSTTTVYVSSHDAVSPVGAGFIGAVLALLAASIVFFFYNRLARSRSGNKGAVRESNDFGMNDLPAQPSGKAWDRK